MNARKQFDEEQALGASRRVLWQKDYSATSLKDIGQAMGLKKSSIYNAFDSKK